MTIRKTYSKKHKNTIIINAICKLILLKKEVTKNSIKEYLISNKIPNTVLNHFDMLTRSQINGFTVLAHAQIESFNLKHEAEIMLNEYSFNLSLEDVELLFKDDNDMCLENIKDKMTLVLMSFRRNNMNIKI